MINKIKVDISEEAFKKLKRNLKSLNKPIKTVNYKKRNMTSKIKWFVDDLGLNELNAWLWITGGAALTALSLVLLSGGGAEPLRYWRVFFLSL